MSTKFSQKCKFHATGLIAESFQQHEVKFRIVSDPDCEEILAGFSLNDGPYAIMKFIVRNDDNDVAFRIFGLVNSTSLEKRSRILEACNILNRKIRYLKFYQDTDGDVNVEYDFPLSSGDDCLGEIAFEMLARTMLILDREFVILTKALYTEEDLQTLVKTKAESISVSDILDEIRSELTEICEDSDNRDNN